MAAPTDAALVRETLDSLEPSTHGPPSPSEAQSTVVRKRIRKRSRQSNYFLRPLSPFPAYFTRRPPRKRPTRRILYGSTQQEQKNEHGSMPFETERDAILFTIRLMHCRTSPKSERNERVQTIQAEAVLSHLERCGYRIVKTDEDRGVKPSNIGE